MPDRLAESLARRAGIQRIEKWLAQEDLVRKTMTAVHLPSVPKNQASSPICALLLYHCGIAFRGNLLTIIVEYTMTLSLQKEHNMIATATEGLNTTLTELEEAL